MIKLTRLSGHVFVLNADLIKYVEAEHDTYVTLTTGDREIVKESLDEVVRLTLRYQQSKRLIPDCDDGASTSPSTPALIG